MLVMLIMLTTMVGMLTLVSGRKRIAPWITPKWSLGQLCTKGLQCVSLLLCYGVRRKKAFRLSFCCRLDALTTMNDLELLQSVVLMGPIDLSFFIRESRETKSYILMDPYKKWSCDCWNAGMLLMALMFPLFLFPSLLLFRFTIFSSVQTSTFTVNFVDLLQSLDVFQYKSYGECRYCNNHHVHNGTRIDAN